MYKSMKGWLKQDVNVNKFISTEADGKETFNATATVYKCFLILKQTVVRLPNGTTVLGTAILYLADAANIDVADMVHIDGFHQRPLAVRFHRDGTGNIQLTEVIL